MNPIVGSLLVKIGLGKALDWWKNRKGNDKIDKYKRLKERLKELEDECN